MGRESDKDFKEQGNKYFNANKFDSAIASYSKEIKINLSNAICTVCKIYLYQESYKPAPGPLPIVQYDVVRAINQPNVRACDQPTCAAATVHAATEDVG